MKKILTIFLMAAISISLSACGKKDEPKQSKQTQETYANLTEWLSSEKDVKCRVNSSDGEIIIQSKGKKVRMDGIAYYGPQSSGNGQEAGHSITDGEWIYVWGGQNGMKFNLKELKNFQSDMQADAQDYSWENWSQKQEEDQVEYECSLANISNAIFLIPAEVDFLDFSNFLTQMEEINNEIKAMPTIQDFNLPSIEGGQGMNKEEIEELFSNMLGNVDIVD
jgi:hypothetical protein